MLGVSQRTQWTQQRRKDAQEKKRTCLPTILPPITSHHATLLLVHLPILVHPRHNLIILLLLLHLIGEPALQKLRHLLIEIIRICIRDRALPAQGAPILRIVLHDDEAADAEDVAAGEPDGPPLEIHAHGARVVLDLGHVGEDLGVDLCADGAGEVLGELGIGDLLGDRGLYAQGGAFVEFCRFSSLVEMGGKGRGWKKAYS